MHNNAGLPSACIRMPEMGASLPGAAPCMTTAATAPLKCDALVKQEGPERPTLDHAQ